MQPNSQKCDRLKKKWISHYIYYIMPDFLDMNWVILQHERVIRRHNHKVIVQQYWDGKQYFTKLGKPPLNIRGIDDRGFMQSSFSPSSSNLILMFHPHLRSEKKLFKDGKIQFEKGINVIRVIRWNDVSEFSLLTDEYYLGSLVLAFLFKCVVTAWN